MAGGAEDLSPTGVRSVPDLVATLVRLRAWAGSPSYAELAKRVGRLRADRGLPDAAPGRVTVYDCFRGGRSRLDRDLVLDLVAALGADSGAVDAWRRALLQLAAPSAGLPVDVRRLPDPHPGFAGREDLLADLAASEPGTTMLITGPPGAGKSELGIQLVHRWTETAASRPPVLYADLLGHDARTPSSESVVDGILTGLAVPAAELVPLDSDDRAELCRRLLDERAAIVLLDNAADLDQVEQLLARRTRARMVVTSRRRFAAAAGRLVELAELPDDEAAAFLSRAVGEERAAAEPDAVAQLVRASGGYPLDLNVLAAALTQRPSWSLSDHVRRLAALPLDELRRPALTASYRQLSGDAQRMYRLLALYPGSELAPESAAALAGLDPTVARRVLSRLHDEHLVRVAPTGRIRVHDLNRAHARWLLDDEEPHSQQQEAMTRLADELTEATHEAADLVGPGAGDLAPEARQRALSWLEDHLADLLALADVGEEWELGLQVGELAREVFDYVDFSGRWLDGEWLQLAALRLGANTEQAGVHRRLGRVYEMTGRLEESLDHLQRAVELGVEDPAFSLNSMGNTLLRLGRFTDAATRHRASHEAAAAAGDRLREGRALGNLGNDYRILGRPEEARTALLEAVVISREADDLHTVVTQTVNLALLHELTGEYDAGFAALDAALEIVEQVGMESARGFAEHTRAMLLHRTGRLDEALLRLDRAAELAQQTGFAVLACEIEVSRAAVRRDRGDLVVATELAEAAWRSSRVQGFQQAEIAALNVLARCRLSAGRLDEAGADFAAALRMAHDQHDLLEVARAEHGAGDAHLAQGDLAAAGLAWGRSLEMFTRLGSPDAHIVAALLEGVAADPVA